MFVMTRKIPNDKLNVHFNLDPTEIFFHIDNNCIQEFDRKNTSEINGNAFIANTYAQFAIKVFQFILEIFFLSNSKIRLLSMLQFFLLGPNSNGYLAHA